MTSGTSQVNAKKLPGGESIYNSQIKESTGCLCDLMAQSQASDLNDCNATVVGSISTSTSSVTSY